MRKLPRGVYPRGGSLYIKVKRDGKWEGIAAGITLLEDPHGLAAARLREKVQAQLDAGLAGPGPITVARYAKRWLETRKTRELVSYNDDVSRLNTHTLPTLGKMPIGEVKPRHIRTWVLNLRQRGLAARTIRNIYAVTSTMFRDAVIDEVIKQSPCMLRRGDLPPIADKDPEWREQAIFTKAEVEQIIGDKRIPLDRRVFYALLCLTGTRFSEAAALRWRHWTPELDPLGRMLVGIAYSNRLRREKDPKTSVTRKVPVHPALAAILEEWRRDGWALYWKRQPTPDDLIVPSRESSDELERHRNVNTSLSTMKRDLADRLGWRERRQHDTRRTFRSLLADAGGSERIIEWIIWGRKHTVAGRYDEPTWVAMCEPVQRLELVSRGEVVPLGSRGSSASGSQDHDNTHEPTDDVSPRNSDTRKRKT